MLLNFEIIFFPFRITCRKWLIVHTNTADFYLKGQFKSEFRIKSSACYKLLQGLHFPKESQDAVRAGKRSY